MAKRPAPARALVPSATAVILLTVPVGIGVAVAGSLMPGAVKEAWPERPAFATGVYTTGISLGAAVSAKKGGAHRWH